MKLANGQNMEVKRIGRVHGDEVKLFDEVRYVSKFERNLIFLGKLDSLGYRYLIHGGAIKVSQGALVIMKGEKISEKNLYKLEETNLLKECQLRQEATSTIKSVRKFPREN